MCLYHKYHIVFSAFLCKKNLSLDICFMTCQNLIICSYAVKNRLIPVVLPVTGRHPSRLCLSWRLMDPHPAGTAHHAPSPVGRSSGCKIWREHWGWLGEHARGGSWNIFELKSFLPNNFYWKMSMNNFLKSHTRTRTSKVGQRNLAHKKGT